LKGNERRIKYANIYVFAATIRRTTTNSANLLHFLGLHSIESSKVVKELRLSVNQICIMNESLSFVCFARKFH